MCDIWKNKMVNELPAEAYLKLYPQLQDINVTGGEPFLRRDFPEVIANMKKACPHARLVVNTNGFMWRKIKEDMEKVILIDPNIAIRLSIDGMGEAHNAIRRIPDGFNSIMKTLNALRSVGVKDLGISFTLLEQNINELQKVQAFAHAEKLQFSLTVATGSAIYFGSDKAQFRPTDPKKRTEVLMKAATEHYRQYDPKELARGWFVSRMVSYLATGKRALLCDAGQGFFYMDSHGNVYTCHLKPWIMGNMLKTPLTEILQNRVHDKKVSVCNDCWMICTAKSMMHQRLIQVAVESLQGKFRHGILPQATV
jgi:radical SAM protein with 4Fe4S-binding SPASM domain